MAETFARLRRPIVIVSAFLLLIGSALVSVLVGRIASRAHRLADYFRETLESSSPLRQLFRTKDEFSFLNRQFNQVINSSPSPEALSVVPTLSIGVSVLHGTEVQVPELLKAADTAMYRAKQGGRNRVECQADRGDVIE